MKQAVDDSSELLGLNYKATKCNAEEYIPGKYQPSGCNIRGTTDARACMAPREDTRLSNPPCTLKETGINRWEWLCWDPQERAIEGFDRIPTNYRMVAKDNHVPCIEEPLDQSQFQPNNQNQIGQLDEWQKRGSQSGNKMYAPGYPHGSVYYGVKCP